MHAYTYYAIHGIHDHIYSYVHLCIHLYAIIIAISIAHFNVKNVEMKEKINKNVNIKKIGL